MKELKSLLTCLVFCSVTVLSAQSDTSSDIVPPPPPPPSEKTELTKEPPVFMVVEVVPEFPGGTAAMMKFLAKNINYPDSAKELGIEGRVIVQFVIDTSGEITDAKVFRGIGYGCDEEVLRVVNMMPNWSPGMQKGKPVRVRFNLPVNFQLDPEEKKPKKKKRRGFFRNKD